MASLLLAAATLGGCSGYRGGTAYSLSERECLARAMYFESNRSSEDGMLAVGTVVMNRIQSAKYPKSLCGVVGEPRQFADGALTKPVSGVAFERALKVADNVVAGERHTGVGEAMHFHTAGYRFPYRNMYYVAAAGGNVFYEKRQPGTFTPINPATLVARAEPPKTPNVQKVLLADASDSVPLPSFRTKSDADEEKPLRGPRRELAKAGQDEDEVPAPRAKSRERTRVAALREDDETPRGRRRDKLARAAPEEEDEAKPARGRQDRTRKIEREVPTPKHKGARSEKTRVASADPDDMPVRPARAGTRATSKTAALEERPTAPPRRETGTRKDKDGHEPIAKARPKREKPTVAELKDLDLPPKR